MEKPKKPVQMAVVGAPHGVKGEVRVKTFTGEPTSLGDYGPLFDAQGRAFEVVQVRPAGTVAVARLQGVTTREQAEALNGTVLFIDRTALPDDLEEEEFYHADLIGLAVTDESGEKIGKVAAIHDFGGGDILELALAGKRIELVPFTRAAVPEVDIRGGKMKIDSVAAGLVERDDAAGEEGGASNRAERSGKDRR